MLEIKAQKNKTADSDFKSFIVKFYTETIAATFVDVIVDYPGIDKNKIVEYLSKIINNSVL